MLAQAGDCGGGIEHDLGAIESQCACAFGKMAVITNVHADTREAQVEDGVSQVARTKVEFFPEPGSDMGDMGLAILAQIASVIADHGGSVVINAFLLALVDRHDQRDMKLASLLLHEPDNG